MARSLAIPTTRSMMPEKPSAPRNREPTMTVRIAARPDEACPKCGASNPNDVQVTVWRVADGTGLRYDCDCCAHTWRPDVQRPAPV